MGHVSYDCSVCLKSFKRKAYLNRHQRTIHGSISTKCPTCGVKFSKRDSYIRHAKNHHPDMESTKLVQNNGNDSPTPENISLDGITNTEVFSAVDQINHDHCLKEHNEKAKIKCV